MGSNQEFETKTNRNVDQLQGILAGDDNSTSFIQIEKLGHVEDVEVGPIYTQKHAEREAAQYEAFHHDAIWTGQWKTTIPDKMTFIQLIKKPTIVHAAKGSKGKSFSKPPPVKVRKDLSHIAKLKLSDHVVFSRASGNSHGIVISKSDKNNAFMVVEFIKGLHNNGGSLFYQNLCVKKSSHVVNKESNISVVEYSNEEKQSDQLAAMKARSYITKVDYDDIQRELESHARWCKTGKLKFDQVETCFKALLRFAFWPLITLAIFWDPYVGFPLLYACIGFATLHEVFKRIQDVYNI